MRSLAQEANSLDNTIAMSSEIIQSASMSSSSISYQRDKLKNTSSTLNKIETSAIPGAEMVIGLIGKAHIRNKLILSLVIAICLSITLYSMGALTVINTIAAPLTPRQSTQHANTAETDHEIVMPELEAGLVLVSEAASKQNEEVD